MLLVTFNGNRRTSAALDSTHVSLDREQRLINSGFSLNFTNLAGLSASDSHMLKAVADPEILVKWPTNMKSMPPRSTAIFVYFFC